MTVTVLLRFLLIGVITFCCCGRDASWIVYDSTNTPMKSANVRQLILEDGKPAWVGTYGDGLFRIERGIWKKTAALSENEYILSIKPGAQGGLWVGTARSGAFFYKAGNWKH